MCIFERNRETGFVNEKHCIFFFFYIKSWSAEFSFNPQRFSFTLPCNADLFWLTSVRISGATCNSTPQLLLQNCCHPQHQRQGKCYGLNSRRVFLFFFFCKCAAVQWISIKVLQRTTEVLGEGRNTPRWFHKSWLWSLMEAELSSTDPRSAVVLSHNFCKQRS